jgi:phage-related baseplate assembly protein
MATEPNFIDRDVNTIIDEMIAWYETETNKKLQPGSPERLLINMFAYREAQIRSQIQSASVQMLVSFSKAPILDFLAELVGVTRLSAAPAICTIQLNFVATHSAITIPAGMRIQTQDGKVIFELTESVDVDANQVTATAEAVCQTSGVIGNGYPIGQVSVILDPQPFLQSASNTNVTAAGSDIETDEQLRGRIKLATSTFSVAGPSGAYIYWAKSASASIIDVAVVNPVPGTVNVYPLIAGATATPVEILNAVQDILNDEKIRPLSDTVVVISPTAQNYTLTVELTLFPDAVVDDTRAKVQAVLERFTQTTQKKLGKNITKAKLTALCMQGDEIDTINEVYSVAFPGFSDVMVSPTQYGLCTDINISIVGTNE